MSAPPGMLESKRFTNAIKKVCGLVTRWILMTCFSRLSHCYMKMMKSVKNTLPGLNMYWWTNSRIPIRFNTNWSDCYQVCTIICSSSEMKTSRSTVGVVRITAMSCVLKKIMVISIKYCWSKIIVPHRQFLMWREQSSTRIGTAHQKHYLPREAMDPRFGFIMLRMTVMKRIILCEQSSLRCAKVSVRQLLQ